MTIVLTRQQAALLLGYTQASWDNLSGKHKQPESSTKKWAQLTTSEKAAYTVLGYTETNWSKISESKTKWESFVVSTGGRKETARSVTPQMHDHAHSIYHDAPTRLRLVARAGTTIVLSRTQAAKVLGYTQASWDDLNQTQPKSSTKKWAQLTTSERSAAMALGYTEQTWSTISQTRTSWSYFILSKAASK